MMLLKLVDNVLPIAPVQHTLPQQVINVLKSVLLDTMAKLQIELVIKIVQLLIINLLMILQIHVKILVLETLMVIDILLNV